MSDPAAGTSRATLSRVSKAAEAEVREVFDFQLYCGDHLQVFEDDDGHHPLYQVVVRAIGEDCEYRICKVDLAGLVALFTRARDRWHPEWMKAREAEPPVEEVPEDDVPF